jgi:hypothetical protein
MNNLDMKITIKFTKRNKESYDITFKNDKEKTDYINSFPNEFFWKIELIE